MTMKKRLLSALLCLVVVLGLMPGALAAGSDEEKAVQVLALMDIMVGDENGNLNLDSSITRAEFTKLVMAASPQRESVGDTASVAPYPDVPRTHWAAPYIQAAVEAGYITGYLDGTFRPSNTITLAEGVTMVLRLLGYQNSDFSGAYPAGQMAAYRNLGLDEGISTAQSGAMTRRDALHLFYNLMTTKLKDGSARYLETLESGVLDSDGEIDLLALLDAVAEGPLLANGDWQSEVSFDLSAASVYRNSSRASLADIAPLDVIYYSDTARSVWAYSDGVEDIDVLEILNTSLEGPLVAEGDWQSEVPFSLSGAAVYRDGSPASVSAIQPMDIVYYSETARTLLAYSDQVTGTLEAIGPSASSPSSVTVAGKTYEIESVTAAFDLSDLGSYQVGDSVTLLLGRDGGVAAVRGPGIIAAQEVYGLITAAENRTYTNSDGSTYTSYSITLLATDGSRPTYAVDTRTFGAGDLVRVTTGEDGVSVRRLNSTSLSGRVSTDASKLGSYPFASGVRILDVNEDESDAVRIYPERLAGVSVKEDMVRFYQLNAQGEITDLILEDVTGDLYEYGVLTRVSEVDQGMALMGSYTVDLAGSSVDITLQNRILGVQVGPCQLQGYAGASGMATVDKIVNLEAVKLDSIAGNTAIGQNNRKYTISENVAVYVVENGSRYNYASLSYVSGGGYTLTGYYDKPESEGGRIRVILARPNQ